MIVCVKCGEQNSPDTEFCRSCNVFLEWQNRPPVMATTQVAPEAVAQQQPAVQQPTDQRVHRHTTPVTTEPQPLRPDDLICGQCGSGNAPGRKFCRKCGQSLAEAVAVRRPWYWRFIPKRSAKKYAAGDRPSRRGGRRFRRVTRWASRALLALLAVVGLLYATVPAFRGSMNHQALSLRNWVQNRFSSELTPIRPTSVQANVSVPDHGPVLAADNARNTYWAAPADGAEPVLTMTFDRPVDIRKAIVRAGIMADFQSAHRPAKLHLVYSTDRTFDVVLADTPEEQTVDIGNSAGTTRIEIHIVGLHRSLQGNTVAISEIELFEEAS